MNAYRTIHMNQFQLNNEVVTVGIPSNSNTYRTIHMNQLQLNDSGW